jgi:hypothetical protein
VADHAESPLDPTTVAVLAHGLLNCVSVFGVAIDVLLRSHQDAELVGRMGPMLEGQLETMTESLRLIARGFPDEILPLLARED